VNSHARVAIDHIGVAMSQLQSIFDNRPPLDVERAVAIKAYDTLAAICGQLVQTFLEE